MPPMELGPVRATSASDIGQARRATARGVSAPAGEPAAPSPRNEALEGALGMLDPGQPPIDAERVEQVRKAVERGSYPLVPAKITDAIIAAGIILRTSGNED